MGGDGGAWPRSAPAVPFASPSTGTRTWSAPANATPTRPTSSSGSRATATIVAYEVHLWQNAGAAADLSPAILERSLFHATGAYFVPNARIHAASCRTNLIPFTAFRGFGAPQAMFVMEAAIDRAAEVMGISRSAIQAKNLLSEGDRFPYGMQVERSQARRSFDEAVERFDLDAARRPGSPTHNAAPG